MRGEDARKRISAARTAQALWALRPAEERARKLRPFRYAIAERMDEIMRVISEEVGKPPMDALAGDVMVTLEQLRYYEQNAGPLLRSRKKGRPWFLYSGTRFVEINEPHGVVLVFAPWNYPLQLSVVPMATAVFAGNAVILKCSEHTPRTARLIEELCIDAGLPDGLVQVSCESHEEASALLGSMPDLVFFTGSSRNGRIVASKAAELMVPTVMELGGKDAALVFDSCNLERTANGVAYGCFSNAGQVCVGTKRVYVHQNIYNEFLQMFLEKVAELRMGTMIESDLGPVRIEKVRRQLRDHVQDAIARGAQLRTPWPSDALAPVVLTDVPEEASLLAEESFGPVVCIAPFENEADAVRMANASPFALSASVWTGDKAQGMRVAKQLQSGSCAVNDVIRNIGNPEVSFGGNRLSGHGRYHGAEGLRTFSRVKTVMISGDTRAREVHWFPFKAHAYAGLRGLLRLRHSAGLASMWKSLRGMWTLLLFLTIGAGAGQAMQSIPTDGSLTVDVKLPPHAHGQIAYLVFTAAPGFPNNRDLALRHEFVPIAQSGSIHQHINLGPLPPGRYAVSVYLDENGNRKLDKNWIGIPKEPVGASNDPRNTLGPPRFEDCAFFHGLTSELISITLV